MNVQVIQNADYTPAAIYIATCAEKSLFLVQYLFIIPPTLSHPAARIASQLWDAAERGVHVRILLNRFSHGRAAGQPVTRAPLELRHPNIDLRYHTSGQVLHSKIIIADATTTLTGSHNLSHWTLTRSHNLSLLIVDTNTASRILAIYNPLFQRAKHATR
jgi:phosphatidylserine/phosphatidylglycerophosphate/cardiolipin synthase-like enzyme